MCEEYIDEVMGNKSNLESNICFFFQYLFFERHLLTSQIIIATPKMITIIKIPTSY